MPIHEKLRGRDAPAMHNYLRVTMCNIHDELADRLDAPAVMHSLRRGKQQVVLPATERYRICPRTTSAPSMAFDRGAARTSVAIRGTCLEVQ